MDTSAPAPREGVRAKGTALAAVTGYVRRNWGDPGMAQLASQLLSRNEALVLDRPILQGSWYAFSDFVALLEAGDAVFPAGTSFARRQAAFGAEQDLRGVYRVFVRLASPAYLIERSARVWRQYYSSGEIHVIESAQGFATFELRAFGSPNAAHCDAVLGWSERAGALTGAPQMRGEHPSCRARGEKRCVYQLRWQ